MASNSRQRAVTRVLVIGALLGSAAAPRCADPDPCVGPGSSIDTSSDALEGELPSWAIGHFGYGHLDVVNYWIQADGTAFWAIDGGDYSACGSQRASFIDGRVHLLGERQTLEDTHTVLVRTTDGRLYADDDGGGDPSCGWLEVQATNLCGRGLGGCGGYSSTVACSWDEAVDASSCAGPDAGSDAGDGGM